MTLPAAFLYQLEQLAENADVVMSACKRSL